MHKLIIILLLTATPAFASQSQTDSLVAILPQLRGEEKLEALQTLVALAEKEPTMGRFATMLLEEAQRQKNIDAQALALITLVEYYFYQFDTDSVFMAGEQALQFLRKHKLYNKTGYVQHNLILRHSYAGQRITALRKAEETPRRAAI